MNSNSLIDYLDIWGFEDDFMVYGDGSLGVGLKASPLDVACWSDDRINDLSSRLGHLLAGLPEGLDLQFIQDISAGNEKLIADHADLGVKVENSLAADLVGERCCGLYSLDQDGLLPCHGLTILLRYSPATVKRPSFWRQAKSFEKSTEAQYASASKRLKQIVCDFSGSLAELGVVTTQIPADELFAQIYRQWNPTRPGPAPSFEHEDIRSSLLFTDLGLTEEGFKLGTMHHRVVSLKGMPDVTFASMATLLRTLPFDSKLFLSIHVPNQTKELEQLQTQRRIAFSMVNGKQNGVRDIDSTAKLEDLETVLEEMVAGGERIFLVSLNIVLRSTDSQEVDSQVSEVLTRIRDLSGAEGMLETLGSFDVFRELALPNARGKERQKKMKTSELADFLPIYGPWPGHENPSILLRSRAGSLVSFDPFSRELANANQIVSGGSGSGKSFMTNILMLQMLKEDPKIIIIDIGGSYQKLCSNLGGQYVSLGLTGDTCLNPFDLSPGASEPDGQKIKFLVNLIEIMTREEGDGRLPRLWRAEIEDAIKKVYKNSKVPSLSALKAELGKHFDPEISKFSRILGQWVQGSAYGDFVDRETNLSLSKNLVCFDLKGLEAHPDLQAACLFIITDFVWREFQADRGRKKFLIFDECWKLLESEAGSQFIGEVFRTFRKYYASVIAISQNIDDFAKSKISGAILPNSSIKWILKQKGADQERLREVLSLNDNECEIVASLTQERGKYSEAFLMAGEDRSAIVIESTPIEYWIATTDPREVAVLEKLSNDNQEWSEWTVLKEAARLYPSGLFGGNA